MNRIAIDTLKKIANPLIAIIISLLLGVFLIIPTGESPLVVYKMLLVGSLGSKSSLFATFACATPLLFTGLAAAMSFRAGVFNIGLEGQLYMGAMASTLCGVYLSFLPPFILVPLCLLSALIAGAIWGYIPAILNVKLDVNIFINCIMMNSVAQLFCNYLSAYPFKGELPISATSKIGNNAYLPKLAGEMNDLNFGFIIAVGLAIIIYVVLFKTRFGYESRAAGISRIFSRYIGVDAAKKTIIIVMISGAIAGLAGAERILGVSHRYIADFSNGVGYTGIAVSLLAMHNPVGCVIAAIFFGALENGAIQMEVMTSISRDLVTSIEAIMIIFMAGSYSFPKLKKFINKRKKGVVNA
jgi:simple sugar transport system permease protein